MTPVTMSYITPTSNITKQMNAHEAGATTAPRTLEDHKQVGQNATIVSASGKLYQIAVRRKWAVEKTQKKAINKRELAILYRRLGDLLEVEADILNEEAPEIVISDILRQQRYPE
jgi:hypothetical protein